VTSAKGSASSSNVRAIAAIRVDASTRMGSGHVMRCLTLAKKLKELDITVVFLSKKHQGNLNQFIKTQGFEVYELSPPSQNIEHQTNEKLWLGCSYQDDATECLQVLRNLKINLLIVDHYSLDYSWQQLLKNNLNRTNSFKIMVIDDLANRKHDCDILLDQTLGRKHSDYSAFVPNHCKLMLGADFIMLRDEFLQQQELAKIKRNETVLVNNILITMGGTDPDNISKKILNWLITFQKSNSQILVTVVANQSSPFIKDLHELGKKYQWIKIICNPKSMAEIMLNADIAIGSSGSTAWERCCLGLPSLSIINAENQNFLNDSLSKEGAIINLGHHLSLNYQRFEESLLQLMNVPSHYHNMVQKSFACCNGLGITKVIDTLAKEFSECVYLQKANYDDCQVLFEWQSNGEVRKYFHNPDPVQWEHHCNWLKSTLMDDKKHLFMVKLQYPSNGLSSSVGVLRLDTLNNRHIIANAQWEISIIIAPEQQGKQYAEKAINEIPNSYKEQGIIAEVHNNNTASHKLFLRTGFTSISKTTYYLNNSSNSGGS
jgi:UDP-2,4-diacetamido-2,4,6-trideoxy-beta-L-altropyranose hydrolase